MKEQFACEHSHQHVGWVKMRGKGHDRRGYLSTIHETVGSTSGNRERDVRSTVACYFPKTRGRPGGMTPGVTGLKREAAITCSQGGFDEGQGTRNYVTSPERRKLRSRDR
ncbi:hypothetical protein AMTRI_Chr06g169010 [Amborella trichopoda]